MPDNDTPEPTPSSRSVWEGYIAVVKLAIVAVLIVGSCTVFRAKKDQPPVVPVVARELVARSGEHSADVYGWLVFPVDGGRNLVAFVRFTGPDAEGVAKRIGADGGKFSTEGGTVCRSLRNAPIVNEANPTPGECTVAFSLVDGAERYVLELADAQAVFRFRVDIVQEDTVGEAAMKRVNEGRARANARQQYEKG